MVNRKSLIKVLTPIGNERQIDEYINSINQNIKDDYDKASKYNAFTDEDWKDDFIEYTNTIYNDLKEYFSKFR